VGASGEADEVDEQDRDDLALLGLGMGVASMAPPQAGQNLKVSGLSVPHWGQAAMGKAY